MKKKVFGKFDNVREVWNFRDEKRKHEKWMKKRRKLYFFRGNDGLKIHLENNGKCGSMVSSFKI